MSKQAIDETMRLEDSRPSEEIFPLEKEYNRIITALNRTGILTILPQSKSLGVIGIDGNEYPIPTQERLQEVFTHNKELADKKMQQGFTQLQLTPIAMPTLQLIDRVKDAILRYATDGKILQTKQNPNDADIPIHVNTDKLLWIWERVRQVIDTSNVVYFPKVYTEHDHQGLTKEEVMQETRLCAVTGWSVGLIEPIPIMPQQEQGGIIGGRKQLEGYSTPNDYLQTLNTATYQGETGWTLEDFLIHFITQLEITNQISHNRSDSNALWLLGSYIPYLGYGLKKLVMVGYWENKRMYISTHRSANKFRICVARSMVRFGI